MRVLIIENDVQLNIAISEFFKIKRFDTVSVKNSLNAIDQIDSEHFYLYVIDINIPNIDGLELLKHIRKQILIPKLSSLPLLWRYNITPQPLKMAVVNTSKSHSI